MFMHVFLCFRDTSGKTLEQAEEMFTTKIKTWQTRVEYRKSRREEAGDVDSEKKLSYTQNVEDTAASPTDQKAV